MSPVRSMTGFARARRVTPGVDIAVGIKSVNHRSLDVHFHNPAELDAYETAMRAAVKQRVARGHIDIRAGVHRLSAAQPLAVNETLLASYVAAFRQAAADHNIAGEPDLNAAFRLPGMLADAPEEETDAEFEKLLISALEEALDALNAFRAREGSELAAVIREHNRNLAGYAAGIESLHQAVVPAYQARLQDRLAELLAGVGVDPQRLAQEVAILVDRSDIHEEIARLKIHSNQIDQLLDCGGEVGKKLDFLLQEMNREANTILSKTGGIGELGIKISDLALAAKADIEKIREQALNLE